MTQRDVVLRVLGRFEVSVGGQEVARNWPSRRSAELVQLLAISPGRRLSRDEVIDALWPHLPADAGAANLRKAAHHARRAIGDDDAVVLRRQQVELFPAAPVTSDVDDFLAAARAAVDRHNASAAAAAAAMYGGELLPSARYEPWAEPERQRLARLHLDLLRLAGDWAHVLERDPTDEAACQGAMRLALAAGQRHRALAHYGRLRQALRDDLGVLPSAETEALYRRSREGLVPARSAIVGRYHELAVIDELLADHGAGAQLVVVRGPPGIGKSALAREVVSRAVAAGWLTIDVTADDPNDAYATLAEVVERLVELRPDSIEVLDARTREVLGMLVPIAGRPHQPELPLTRHRMLGAVQRLIQAVAHGARTALVIDDMERADPASLEVLTLLGDRHIGRLVVTMAHREPSTNLALHRALARASRLRTPIVMTLEPLAAADAEALAQATNPSVDADDAGRIAARADGVPLFVVELATGGGGDGELDGDAVRRAIESRMVDLDAHRIAWLRRLAVAGGPVDLTAVLALTGCEEDEADALLDDALAAGILVVDQGRYRFRHELVRAALGEQLPPHQQAAVHRDAARRLAELGARPGRVAGHWSAGHRPAEAADWFVRAADYAIRLGGYAAAAGFAGEALSCVADHPGALRRRAEALDALGDPGAVAAYRAAIAAATPDEARELQPLQALAQIKMGDPHGALQTIDGAEPRSLPSKVAHALTMSGAALMGVTGPEDGTRLSALGRQLALESRDPATLVVAAWSQAAIAHARGELRESLRADLADTRAVPQLAVTVFDGQLCITQRLLYGNRPYEDVIRFTDEFAAEAERLGASRGLAFATTLRGEAELLSGRLNDAERDLRRGAELHRAIDGATGEAFSLQRLAELAHVHGDVERARRLLDEALDIARSSGVGFHLLDRIYGTKIAVAPDARSAHDMVLEAEEAVCGPFETCPGCRITLAVPAAIAAAEAGDLERLDRYEETCAFLADVVMQLPAWSAALEEVRAHRCLAHGDRSGAAERFRSAAATFGDVGQPIDAARCRARASGLAR